MKYQTVTERILENNFKELKDNLSEEEKKVVIAILKAEDINEKRKGFGLKPSIIIDFLKAEEEPKLITKAPDKLVEEITDLMRKKEPEKKKE